MGGGLSTRRHGTIYIYIYIYLYLHPIPNKTRGEEGGLGSQVGPDSGLIWEPTFPSQGLQVAL